MNSTKDETPELAARGFQENFASAAVFDDNHGGDRDTNAELAQAPAPRVGPAPMSTELRKALVEALLPLTSRVRTDKTAVKLKDGSSRWTHERLTFELMALHVSGGRPRGVCPIKPGEDVTMVAMLDLDSHKGETSWADMEVRASKVRVELLLGGYEPVAFRSSGGRGIHLIMLWETPQDAYSVRRGLRAVIEHCGYVDAAGTGGVAAGCIEVFPKQDRVSLTGFGNQFILPLAGHSEPLDLEFGIPLGRDYVIGMQWPMSKPVVKHDRAERKVAVVSDSAESLSKVRDALFAIPNDGTDEAHGYDWWWPIMCAVHEALDGSEEARLLCVEWSEQNPRFNEAEFEARIWPYMKKDGAITRATLFKQAGENGWGKSIISADGFDEVPEAGPSPTHLAQILIDELRRVPLDAIVSTWARRTAAMPKDAGALVLDEVVRLTGLGRRILAAALGDARRDLKREQRRKEVERRAAKRVMMVYRPEDSVSQSREIGSLILKSEPPEAMLSFGGCLSQIVDAPMAQAHHFDSEDADAPTTLHVRPHTQATMRALVEKRALMCVETEQGRKPIAVPILLLDGLLELDSAEAPQLTGLLTHPIALGDGAILSANGLHKRVGLFLSGVTGSDYRPYTQSEAHAAMGRIRAATLEGFEFASDLDATVAVAGLFTGVQRRLLDMAPGLALLAAAQSSGKTTFLRIVHIILTGRDLPVTTLPIGNEAEVEKRLLSLLMQSPAMVAFDNIPDGFTVHSGSLSAAMTSSTFEGRVLGVSRMATVPTNVLIALTGNNLTFGADEISRWLVARLAPRHARPEERKFRHADIVAHALAHREAVLRDVVGIVSGFINSGARMSLTGTRFPKWDRMVRQPLIWAGAADVARVFRINEGESEHAQGLRGLLLALHEVFGDRLFYAREVADATQQLGTGVASPLPGRLSDALEALGVKDVHRSRSVTRVLSAKSERTVTIDEDAGTTLRLCRRVDRDGISAFCLSTAG